MILIRLSLLIGLTGFFSCESLERTKTQSERLKYDLPPRPVIEKILFHEREGGLYLTYGEYMKLEKNIIEYRIYIRKLEAMIILINREENDEFKD